MNLDSLIKVRDALNLKARVDPELYGLADQVAAALLDETPEAARPGVEATLAKIRRSGSMQSLDIPLTVASLGDLVRVVSRHTLHRGR